MANSFTVMSNMNTIGKNDGAMLLTLRNVSLFPFVLTPVFVDEKEAVERMRKAYDGNRLVAFFQELGDDFPEFINRHPECRIKTVNYQGRELSAVGCRARQAYRMINCGRLPKWRCARSMWHPIPVLP